MSEAYKKLIKTLQTIFEMDKADLDFGIYRIMNQKREEINRFLEHDLLPQVQEAFADYAKGGKSEVQAELDQLIKTLTEAGMDPEQSPKVKELREKAKASVDMVALENEVYSHLHTFFSRYYDKGDFISQRRYKKDTYAIPYEGEEVKLYWANQDQYYIKSSEHLRDYAFTVMDEQKNVRIKLVEADTEKDNVKAESGKERRFVLDADNPLSVENDELHIHFHYIPAGKKKQDALNKEAVDTLFKQQGFEEWMPLLKQKAPTESNPDRTLLEKHLNEYTARNTFDYFIHKDLGGFLRRELDFYIKNEVLYLDDIDDAAFAVTEQHLRKIKVIRTIAHKIIRMLAQIEDFQKKLWLKKKFVVETNYCITLDRVPEALYPLIVDNPAQHQEWVKLGFIENNTTIAEGYLKENPFLVLDTRFFDDDFKDTLLASIEDFDRHCDGLLINSDNFQALALLGEKHNNNVKCIYIDPPYNTSSTPILYKNEYKHSSWASLIKNRVDISKPLLSPEGVKIVAIDDTELANLSKILEESFVDNRITRVSVVHNPKGSITKDFNRVHEYAIFITNEDIKNAIARTLEENKTPRKMRRWGENSLRTDRRPSFYPIYVKDGKIVRIGEVPDDNFHPAGRNVQLPSGETEIWPIDQDGIERRWNFGLDSIRENLERITIREVDGTLDLFVTHELTVPKTVWNGGIFDAGKYGNTLLIDVLGNKIFDFPKSIHNVKRCINLATASTKNGLVLDYFGGSGTTGHAVISLNRDDQGTRKYILVEMGNHFQTVLKPRITKIIHSESWQDGKPTAPETGISHCFKYIHLESYEDALNNLILKPRTEQQEDLLEHNAELREDYMLGYWLELETADSPSLLNIEQFEDPFNYKLNIATGSVGATKATRVDLVETFNYLIGLTAKHIDTVRGFKVITGTNPKGESVLVIWRNLMEKDNAALEEFLDKSGYNPRDTEYEHIYVNGDHTLEDPHSKVKMIEIEFKRLMFDVQNV